MDHRVPTSAPARDASARRTVGGLLRDALPELRVWILNRRGVARLGNESASDLVQSVCREALAAREGFADRGDASFRAWVRRLAQRKLADRARYWSTRRRETGRRAELPLDERDAGLASSGPTPEECASRLELSRKLLERIEKLPPSQRVVMELQLREQLSTQEIARRLGKSEVAVRILRCRALAEIGRGIERGMS